MAEFDAIWMFQIIGQRFKMIENPLQMGCFEAQECYFVVFYSNDKVAIALWRGADQDQLEFKEAIAMFKRTNFRLVKNQQESRNRSASTIEDFSKLKSKLDLGEKKSTNTMRD